MLRTSDDADTLCEIKRPPRLEAIFNESDLFFLSGFLFRFFRFFFSFLLLGGLGYFGRFLLFSSFFSHLLETVDPAGRIHDLLLAGVERMAGGADFHLHLFDGGAGLDNVAARADDFGVSEVLWVDVFLHIPTNMQIRYKYTNTSVSIC